MFNYKSSFRLCQLHGVKVLIFLLLVIIVKLMVDYADVLSVDRGMDQRNVMEKQRRLPDALIIGVQKGGTRALLEFMSLNQQITISQFELHFFSKDEIYNRGLEWYRSQMPLALPGQIVIEKTPKYINAKSAAGRIKHMKEQIKLIAIFRDPVERLISAWVHFHAKYPEDFGKSISEFLAYKNGRIKTDNDFVKRGLYVKQMEKWYKLFPKEHFFLIDSHKFVENPLPIVNELEEFLGLSCHVSHNDIYFDEEKGFYCRKINGSNVCLGESKGRPHPYVRKEILNQFYEYYRPYNAEFVKLTGMNFSFARK